MKPKDHKLILISGYIFSLLEKEAIKRKITVDKVIEALIQSSFESLESLEDFDWSNIFA